MISMVKALKIVEACIDEMYRNSTPPISWKEVLKKYGGTHKPFYENHTITEEKYVEIKEKYAKI